MNFVIGQKVGAFTSFGVVIGNVEEVFTGDWFAVRGDDNFIVEARGKFIFPVWRGSYTQEDAMRLSKLAKSLGNCVLERDIMNLHKLNLWYYQGVLRELNRLRKELSHDVADAHAVERIDKFLDWANHGFQGESVCG
nr:hypothetical protein [uncultured Anaeromusa sp.]